MAEWENGYFSSQDILSHLQFFKSKEKTLSEAVNSCGPPTAEPIICSPRMELFWNKMKIQMATVCEEEVDWSF